MHDITHTFDDTRHGDARAMTALAPHAPRLDPSAVTGVLCARLAMCRHCVLLLIVGTASWTTWQSCLGSLCCAAFARGVEMCNADWRLCPRAAPHCRSSVSDAGTCRRSCKLLNGQRSAIQPTDKIDITRCEPPDGLDHDGRFAAAVLFGSRSICHHRRRLGVATACERGASALSQRGSSAPYKVYFLPFSYQKSVRNNRTTLRNLKTSPYRRRVGPSPMKNL